MAVAHSAASESHTGTTGSTNQASFNWTHTQTGTPRGVVVFVHTNGSTNLISSVTYGTVTLTAVTGGSAVDTAGEACRTDAYFAGSGLPTGNQTITVNRTNNATVMYATAATVTAGADTAIPETVVLLEGDGTLAEQSIDDTSPGQNSVRYAGITSGLNNVPATGASSTLLHSIDYGNNYTAASVRETTAGQGSRSVGFSSGTTDDRAAVHLAIRELVPRTETPIVGAFTLTGGSPTLTKASPKAIDAGTGSFSLTGNPATTLHNPQIAGDTGSFALSGQPATLAVAHTLSAETGTFALTGNPATLAKVVAKNLDAGTGTFALTGNPAVTTHNYSLAAATGAFAVTGNPVTLTHNPKVEAATGSFALTGGNPTLARGYYLSGGTGNFTETGQSATFTRTYTTTATAGAFALTGNPATLTYAAADELGAIVGTFVLTGNSATFQVTAATELEAATGAFVFNGGNPTLSVNHPLSAATGAFALTGQNADLRQDYKLAAVTGAFVFTGRPAALARGLFFNPLAGSYTLTGNSISIGIFANYTLPVATGEFTVTGSAAQLARTRIFLPALGTYALIDQPITYQYTPRRRVILIF